MSKLLILHLVIVSSQALPHCQEIYAGNARICSKVKDYYKSQFPLPHPCVIKSEFNIRQLLQFNVDEQTFTLMVDLLLQWKDDRVTSEGVYNTINWFPIIQTNDVWVPTIHFPGAVKVEKIGTKLGYTRNASEFSMKETMILKMTCQMNLTSVPFDHQVCDISFVNYLGKEDRIAFETALIMTNDEDIKSGSLPFSPKVKSVPTSIDEDGFSQGAIRFAMIRHSNHIYQLIGSFYLPSAIFAIISMLSFFIKPELVRSCSQIFTLIFLYFLGTWKNGNDCDIVLDSDQHLCISRRSQWTRFQFL